MLTSGPAPGESPTEFGRRLAANCGQDAHDMVLSRIRTGQYPATNSPDWDRWATTAILDLSEGRQPHGGLAYGCGFPLPDGTCGLHRAHTGQHQPRMRIVR